jgi:AAA family ATP:ADP antiporter
VQGTKTFSSRASDFVDNLTLKMRGDLHGEELLKVIWLSMTLFFIVGGYWLLRSLKDPIMSAITGVSCLKLYLWYQCY